jgi:hypothetical protein
VPLTRQNSKRRSSSSSEVRQPRQPGLRAAAEIIEDGYIESPLERPPSFNYREALKTDQEYDYGDFLVKPFDPNGWRFTPEMLHADTELQAYY